MLIPRNIRPLTQAFDGFNFPKCQSLKPCQSSDADSRLTSFSSKCINTRSYFNCFVHFLLISTRLLCIYISCNLLALSVCHLLILVVSNVMLKLLNASKISEAHGNTSKQHYYNYNLTTEMWFDCWKFKHTNTFHDKIAVKVAELRCWWYWES